VFESSNKVTLLVKPKVFSIRYISGYDNSKSTPFTAKWVYILLSSFSTSVSCIICSAKYTAQQLTVTSAAVFITCARLDNSRKEYIATRPDTIWMMMNSYWYFTAAAQIKTMVLTERLMSIYHTRIQYPELKKE
jgi:hypothetical protein